jgi:hypothetical protein
VDQVVQADQTVPLVTMVITDQVDQAVQAVQVDLVVRLVQEVRQIGLQILVVALLMDLTVPHSSSPLVIMLFGMVRFIPHKVM